MIDNPQIEMVVDIPCVIGEGPLWNAEQQALYWTDIPSGRLYRYIPLTEQVETLYEGEKVGGFTFQEDGTLLFFCEHGTVRHFDGKKLRTVIPSLPNAEEMIFNDVIADPLGGVFCGTKSIDLTPGKTGDLYYLCSDGQITHLLANVQCTNGLAFSRDMQTLYYTDTLAGTIYRFNYDRHSAAITNMDVFIEKRVAGESLDGMTVDADDHIWSAIWGAGSLVRYSPDGTEVARIALPPVRVSSLTFGGPNYEDIYVTTAGGEDRQKFGNGAGALFRIRAGIKGLPEYRSKVRIES